MMCSNVVPKPKYIKAKPLFDKNAFMFYGHDAPYDIYIRCTNKVFFCESCRIFRHYDNAVLKKSIRGGNRFFTDITNYVNTI